MNMKKISNLILVLGIASAFCFSACVDKFAVGDAFLEKAPGSISTETLSIFSK